MNRLYAAMALVMVFSLPGFAQIRIPSYLISVTFQKTTNIIFPYRIEKADIGSGDVIGHKDDVLPNVLFLKAGRKKFNPTNLSVYTSDGKFYSFIVRYTDEPDTLNLSFAACPNGKIKLPDSVNEEKLDSDAVEINDEAPFLHCKIKFEKMKGVLNGIYIKDHLLWFKIKVSNRSQIDYTPEYIRFFVLEKHTSKRTAVQEQDLDPLWNKSVNTLPGEKSATYVFGFESFTLPRGKAFVVQISEKNGGRELNLIIRPKTLLKSKSI